MLILDRMEGFSICVARPQLRTSSISLASSSFFSSTLQMSLNAWLILSIFLFLLQIIEQRHAAGTDLSLINKFILGEMH